MKIFNLGPIKEGEVKFNNMVIIWGMNNSGKTMLTYLLYAIQEEFRKYPFTFSNPHIDGVHNYEIVNSGKEITISMDEIYSLYNKFQEYFEEKAQTILSEYFSIDQSYFSNFSIKFDENEIYNAIPIKRKKSRGFHRQRVEGQIVQSTFVLAKSDAGYEFRLLKQNTDIEFMDEEDHTPSKKTLNFSLESFDNYLSGFFKFMTNRAKNIYFPAERIGINQFREELKSYRAVSDNDFLISKSRTSNYPKPIEDYINLMFGIEYQDKSERYREELSDLIDGEFIYNEDTDDFEYKNKLMPKSVPFKVISSSLKSLFGIEEYLRWTRMLNSSSIIIDEPEMNLHPTKQVEIIDFFTKLIMDNGISMILSTHSSYITRKLLNLLIENENFPEQSKSISKENVNIYEIKEGKIKQIDLIESQDFIENFDTVSLALDEEYYKLIGVEE